MHGALLRFLPAGAQPEGRDDLHRAVLTIAGAFIAAALGFTIAVMQAYWGIWEAASICAALGSVAAALPFWVRRTGRWRIAAGVLTGLVWSASFAVAALTGGTMLAALFYLVFAAAVATITLGPRVGATVAVANTIVVAALYGLRVVGSEAPHQVEAEIALSSGMRGALMFNFALAALVTAYEWMRAATLRESEQSERRYRALADYGPDLIAEVDSGGRIAHVAGGSRELDAQLGGRAALEVIHPDDRVAAGDAMRLLETQASVRVGPIRWLLGECEPRWLEASLTRFRTGREWRFLVVARDVTSRVQLEAQLRQSQKMQALGQLATGLAHDFNNVLTVVSGYAESLAGRLKSDAEASGALEEIQRASDQGAALTRRLLALSRPSALKRVAVDLNALVRDHEQMLRVMLGESITLLLEVAPGEALVRADAGALEQVLLNLVANARDALPNGGTVRVATHARGGRATLVVHDNGSGIQPLLRERIFEPFVTTKPAGGGSGLGLYVVYAIVTGLGGEIDLQTEVGLGTRVSVKLPSLPADARSAAVASRRDRARGGSERVLVVEDRPELRELLRAALADAGYQVIVAADGVEALALDVRDRIDLVVSDVVMPRMGGVALVAAMREKRPALRALFVSGHATERVPLGPRDRLLRKPFLMQEMQRTVRDVLDGV